MLAENQALIDLKKQVVGLRKAQDASFVAQQKQALAVSDAKGLLLVDTCMSGQQHAHGFTYRGCLVSWAACQEVWNELLCIGLDWGRMNLQEQAGLWH